MAKQLGWGGGKKRRNIAIPYIESLIVYCWVSWLGWCANMCICALNRAHNGVQKTIRVYSWLARTLNDSVYLMLKVICIQFVRGSCSLICYSVHRYAHGLGDCC